MQKLEWLPLYIDRLLSSPSWNDMQDYQRAWYIQLLLRCTRSERLGYLKMDSSLWTIAGARRKDFWESHKSAVLACFKVREMEGHQWIYNERLLAVMGEQSEKYRKKKPPGESQSYSLSVLDLDSNKSKEELCEKCEGTGWRASGLTPGRVKECECKSLKGNGTTYA